MAKEENGSTFAVTFAAAFMLLFGCKLSFYKQKSKRISSVTAYVTTFFCHVCNTF